MFFANWTELRRGGLRFFSQSTQTNDMSPRVKLEDYITLGQTLAIVGNPAPFHGETVKNESLKMLENLEACNLPRSRSSARQVKDWQLYVHPRSGFLVADSQVQISTLMISLLQVIYDEVREQRAIRIDQNEVSIPFSAVCTQRPYTSTQMQLHAEAVQCLDVGAVRSAIVMGWCFAYDVIRYWIFSEPSRLSAFNTELAKLTKRATGNRIYLDIVHYDDFFSNKSPGEAEVIGIAERASLFGGKVADKLRHYLDQRNNYAHASSAQPTQSQAIAYLEHLADIILNPPFHQPPPPKVTE